MFACFITKCFSVLQTPRPLCLVVFCLFSWCLMMSCYCFLFFLRCWCFIDFLMMSFIVCFIVCFTECFSVLQTPRPPCLFATFVFIVFYLRCWCFIVCLIVSLPDVSLSCKLLGHRGLDLPSVAQVRLVSHLGFCIDF